MEHSKRKPSKLSSYEERLMKEDYHSNKNKYKCNRYENYDDSDYNKEKRHKKEEYHSNKSKYRYNRYENYDEAECSKEKRQKRRDYSSKDKYSTPNTLSQSSSSVRKYKDYSKKANKHEETVISNLKAIRTAVEVDTELVMKKTVGKKLEFSPRNQFGFSLSAKESVKEKDLSNDDRCTDSEEEMLFNWENHRYELNKLFFSEKDVIKRGTEEYHDFWKFLKKYQGLQKQKKIREMCKNEGLRKDGGRDDRTFSSIYELPMNFDKRYNINFGLNFKNTDDLYCQLLPRDTEDKNKSLSRKKISEFKFVLLLYLDFIQKQKFEKYKKLRKSQADLPIAAYKEEIINTVKKNNIVIIAGDTGCGKSTQVPQYLLAAGFSNIACTQPRRIACISLSKRVAHETLNEYGSKVGFQIRFEKHKTEHTKILFVTEGLLLRQVSMDSSLSSYDVIILDEIHERHLHTDFLLGIMKCLLMQRNDVKVLLMSATINIQLFQNYFMGKAPVIQVPGRLYPIKMKYFPIPEIELANKQEKINPAPYIRVMQLIDSKYPSDERGDMLIFLSGMSEICSIVDAARLYAQQTNKWIILPLHSTLSVSEQEKVFDIAPEGIRKCIVSTNIAETSVTIDGVRFVVDSGKVKEMSYDPCSKMQKLKEFWISQASAEQRKGRAGRTGPGVCFRLYDEQEYSAFAQYSTPELLRVPLDSLVLQMMSMGLPNIRLFPFIEPPVTESLENSISSLKTQAAITDNEALTTVGKLLSQLPMDVSLGKMLIMGSLFHQVDPVLSLAAAMSVQSPFTNRAHRDPECQSAIKSLESDHGDPFTLLTSYREWLNIKLEGHENSRKWCRKRGLEEQRFYEMTKLRHQFSQLLHDSGLQDVTGSKHLPLTSAERIKRKGELKQLREMKRDLHRDGPRKSKVLKVTDGDEMHSDDDSRTDVKDVDFRIKNDQKQLREIYRSSYVESYKDMIMLKVILCSGLYPNVAIADEHNNYKPGSEQLFHTSSKPFTILHPNSVFSSHPEVLQVRDSDIVELPGFTSRHPASTNYQLLAYVSLLETNKAYIVNTLRCPTAQILLLFAHSINTNADFTVISCDDFIELKFADDMVVLNVIFQAVLLRTKWKQLLDLRIKASQNTVENQDNIISEANQLEKDLSAGLVTFYQTEILYSQRRLLDADLKVLYRGPGPPDCILSGNPFSEDGREPCLDNDIKGGVDLTEFLTYNCLLDTECKVTTITSVDLVCQYCDAEYHTTILEHLGHMMQCLKKVSLSVPEEDESEIENSNLSKKKFECDMCNKTFWLTIKDIFKHKKLHSQ